MAKVFIGVGHGGNDSGATANGFKEKDLNLVTALACRDELKRHGVDVLISRETDERVALAERIKMCNAYAPDLAADIHYNAGGGDGAEVFHSKRDRRDDALAQNILDAIVATGQNSRGLKTKEKSNGDAYFGFIREINCPAVLVECGFIDNKKDLAGFDEIEEQKVFGVAIAKGFLKTLEIAWQEPVAESPAGALYIVGAYSSQESAEALRERLTAAGFSAIIKVTE